MNFGVPNNQSLFPNCYYFVSIVLFLLFPHFELCCTWTVCPACKNFTMKRQSKGQTRCCIFLVSCIWVSLSHLILSSIKQQLQQMSFQISAGTLLHWELHCTGRKGSCLPLTHYFEKLKHSLAGCYLPNVGAACGVGLSRCWSKVM